MSVFLGLSIVILAIVALYASERLVFRRSHTGAVRFVFWSTFPDAWGAILLASIVAGVAIVAVIARIM